MISAQRESTSLIEFVRSIKETDISPQKRQQLIGRFLEAKARERGIPVHGTFELTPLCNLDCKMCYIHLENSRFSPKHLLNGDLWESIMEQAVKAGMKSATLTGGECLTYPDFDRLFLFLRKAGVTVGVLTNGVLIDERRVDFFKQNAPSHIQVSLYGSNEETYEKVTGHRVYKRVLENIHGLKDAGIHTQISITPNRFMLKDMEALVRLAHSLQLPYEINCKLVSPRSNTGRVVEDFTVEQYVSIYRIRANLVNMDLTPNDPSELPDEKHDGSDSFGLLCGAGRSSFAVSYEGKLMPCVSLEEFAVPILSIGFQKAWEQVHDYAINYPIPRECGGCAYYPICTHCQALHKNAPKGHCDKGICQRTRKIAEAGFFHYTNKQGSENG